MPSVSVIVPCYNEQATIRQLLEAIYSQDYPRSDMEVILADGLSSDCTRQEIAAFQQDFPDLLVKVVDNPERIIPAALNRAIRAAQGEWIVRLDAHSLPYPDYIRRSLAPLQAGLGDNVGGIWEIHPAGSGWQARAVAAAAAHPLGAGDARYRLVGLAGSARTTGARAVDTVPFGAFHRSLVDRIGFFDETLQTNEDYEFNVRVRRSGGQVWMDPAIRCVYFARPTLASLARQYWRYGYWKARMLRRYAATLRWRQFLPPAFVLCLVILSLLSFWLPAARGLLAVLLGGYCLALLLAGGQAALKKRDPALLAGLPLAIGLMHLAWGSAFLWSLLR